MGRKSLAEHFFEEYAQEEPGEDTWLVVYDFPGINPRTKFYDNLHRIESLAGDGSLVQSSVFMTRDQRAAKAVKDLVQHYEGMVMVFKGDLVNF
jgi:hypothetical protein